MNSEHLERIRRSRMILQNPYAHLDGDGGYDANLPTGPARFIFADLESLRHPIYRKTSIGKRPSRRDIEFVARNLQNMLWSNRSEIFPGRVIDSPLDVLEPPAALSCLGYQLELAESLGQHRDTSGTFEVAGIIDRLNKVVHISRQFPPPIRKFTAAHELGHAILHEATGLHRDRPMDGASTRIRHDPDEREANVFATYFLMPASQMRLEFERRFGNGQFVLNDETAFRLNAGNLDKLQKSCNTLRDVSKLLAGATHYGGIQMYSLAERFQVSTEAMAIRLEELKLIRY